jgi:hypothetical protein
VSRAWACLYSLAFMQLCKSRTRMKRSHHKSATRSQQRVNVRSELSTMLLLNTTQNDFIQLSASRLFRRFTLIVTLILTLFRSLTLTHNQSHHAKRETSTNENRHRRNKNKASNLHKSKKERSKSPRERCNERSSKRRAHCRLTKTNTSLPNPYKSRIKSLGVQY